MKNRVFAIITLTCAGIAHAGGPGHDNHGKFFLSPDNSGGEDAHMTVSGIIGAGINFQFRDDWTWTKKTLVCLTPGAGKELLDWGGGSGFSKRDMWSNFKGCALGFAASQTLIWTFDAEKREIRAMFSVPLGN